LKLCLEKMTEKNRLYKRKIKKQLYFSGALSCVELSKLNDMSIPLTAKHLDELIADGEVEEMGLALSTGGRRPVLYSLKHDLTYVVSVWVDQLVTRIAMLDMKNRYVGEMKKFDLELSSDPQPLQILAKEIKQFIAESGISKEKIAGVGIAMPGFIDVERGLNHSFFKVKETDIVSYLRSVIDLPVLIDNDSSVIALAELRFGSAKGRLNAMVLNIGWGIGLGMILNGSLFRGNNGFAGEFSHIPLFTNNKMCSCGKMGCLETETSLLVILEKAKEGLLAGRASLLEGVDTENKELFASAIMKAALKGDRFAIEILSEAGYNIGRGVAILVHLLNPETIILSGIGSVGSKLWLTPIQQALNEHCIPKIAEHLTVEASSMGSEAGLVGAASLIMEHYDELNEKKIKTIKKYSLQKN